MAFQLALFPGVVPLEPPAAAAPAPEAETVAVQDSVRQMGLFDAQVRQRRAAFDAVARGDLPRAMALLEGLTPDPSVPSMLRRVAELHGEIERARIQPLAGRVARYIEFGRSLASESDPWCDLGHALVAQAAADLGPSVHAGRLLLEARQIEQAKRVLLSLLGPPSAAALLALGDVEFAQGERLASRQHYRDALLLDPFDLALDGVTDEDVAALPTVAELEVEVDGDPRAWCAPVGIVAGVLPRPRERIGDLPLPTTISPDRAAALVRARQFVDALVRAGAPEVGSSREALLEIRRCMKGASGPMFAWYIAHQMGASRRTPAHSFNRYVRSITAAMSGPFQYGSIHRSRWSVHPFCARRQ